MRHADRNDPGPAPTGAVGHLAFRVLIVLALATVGVLDVAVLLTAATAFVILDLLAPRQRPDAAPAR